MSLQERLGSRLGGMSNFPQMGQGKHRAAFVVSPQHGVVSCVHLISTNLTSCIWKEI